MRTNAEIMRLQVSDQMIEHLRDTPRDETMASMRTLDTFHDFLASVAAGKHERHMAESTSMALVCMAIVLDRHIDRLDQPEEGEVDV